MQLSLNWQHLLSHINYKTADTSSKAESSINSTCVSFFSELSSKLASTNSASAAVNVLRSSEKTNLKLFSFHSHGFALKSELVCTSALLFVFGANYTQNYMNIK